MAARRGPCRGDEIKAVRTYGCLSFHRFAARIFSEAAFNGTAKIAGASFTFFQSGMVTVTLATPSPASLGTRREKQRGGEPSRLLTWPRAL